MDNIKFYGLDNSYLLFFLSVLDYKTEILEEVKKPSDPEAKNFLILDFNPLKFSKGEAEELNYGWTKHFGYFNLDTPTSPLYKTLITRAIDLGYTIIIDCSENGTIDHRGNTEELKSFFSNFDKSKLLIANSFYRFNEEEFFGIPYRYIPIFLLQSYFYNPNKTKSFEQVYNPNPKKDFLIPIYHGRLHKLKALVSLHSNNLLKNSDFSLIYLSDNVTKRLNTDARDIKDSLKDLDIAIDNFIPKVLESDLFVADMNFDKIRAPFNFFNNYKVYIALETKYNSKKKYIFATEKTYKGFSAAIPTVALSNRYFDTHMQDLGFDLFSSSLVTEFYSLSDQERTKFLPKFCKELYENLHKKEIIDGIKNNFALMKNRSYIKDIVSKYFINYL